MRRRVKVFFDGGYRPATGMETAVVVRGKEYVRRGLGPGSGMEAEWLALIEAVRIADELELEEAVFLGDSLAVIGQARGPAKGREPQADGDQTVGELALPNGPIRLRHIKRAQNLAGIVLARLHAR